MKGIISWAIVLTVLWNCQTKEEKPTVIDQIDPLAIRAVAQPQSVSIQELFVQLPADVWSGLPDELRFLSDRTTREKIVQNTSAYTHISVRVEPERYVFYLSDLPLPKGMKAVEATSDDEDAPSYYNNQALYLQAYRHSDGRLLVFMNVVYWKSGDFMIESKEHLAVLRWYDPQTGAWTVANPLPGKALSDLKRLANCIWWPTDYDENKQESADIPVLECRCPDMPRERDALVWQGDRFVLEKQAISWDEYSKW